MLIMVAVSLDEVVAMIQCLRTARRAGGSARRLFWTGGTVPARAEDIGLAWRPAPPWIEIAAPWVFGSTGPAFTLDSVLGALVFVVAFVAWAEVARAARVLNVLIGIALTPSSGGCRMFLSGCA
jgi:hypothetical protein